MHIWENRIPKLRGTVSPSTVSLTLALPSFTPNSAQLNTKQCRKINKIHAKYFHAT